MTTILDNAKHIPQKHLSTRKRVAHCARHLIQDVTETEVINSLKEVPRVKDRAGRCRVDSSQNQNATRSDIQKGQKDLLVTQENNKA